MLRYIFVALAGLVLLTVTLIPEDAYARRGGGGFHGGGMRAGGFHGGGVRAGGFRGGGARYAGRGVGYRGGRYAGRGYGYRRAGWYGGRYYRPGVGWGVGAAAVGAAAAAGAYGAYGYGRNCYTNSYGTWVCPGQYGYGY